MPTADAIQLLKDRYPDVIWIQRDNIILGTLTVKSDYEDKHYDTYNINVNKSNNTIKVWHDGTPTVINCSELTEESLIALLEITI